MLIEIDELLDAVPVAVLRLDINGAVAFVNRVAASFFAIPAARLPLSLIEATRDAHLEQAVREAAGEAVEVRMVHRPAVVLVSVARIAGGQRLVFVQDLTDQRRLERVRQEFIANLSHELKTPLASLSLAAESLLGNPEPQVARRFAQRAVDEAVHLSAILDNLRQLTEMEAGRMKRVDSVVDLRDLLEEVRERSRPGRSLMIDLPEPIEILADRPKLSQALTNLVDNAVKFSPPDTPIEISAVRLGAEVMISVRDHGPGISPEHWDKVFERFYKVDPARTRDLPGSGLGLAITKHLVQAHGGRIWTRGAENGGQIFTIALPSSTFTAS